MKYLTFTVIIISLFLIIISCKSGNSTVDIEQSEEMTDYEGNVYSTVLIGSQIWMAENLRTRYTPEGRLLEGVYLYGNNETNVASYGRLYTLQAAVEACPPGWHLPTEEEWNTLLETVGPNSSLQLREGGNRGFNAGFGGYRIYEGIYFDLGEWGVYWTSTVFTSDHNIVMNFFPDNNEVITSGYGIIGAVSVRYIKND